MKLKILFNVLGSLCLVGAIISFFYYWDTTRIHFMGLKSKNSFAFEPLPEKYSEYDPKTEISIISAEDISTKRADLQKAVLGTNSLSDIKPYLSQVVFKSNAPHIYSTPTCLFENPLFKSFYCQLRFYKKWKNLKQIHEVSFDFTPSFIYKAHFFEAENSNGKLIIYNHGYAGTYHQQSHFLQKLNELGYHVAALNMTTYGDNPIDGAHPFRKAVNGNFDIVPYPLEIIFKPVVGMVTFAAERFNITDINMFGVSAGGWITAVSAALDPRIKKSYPIAGVLPLSLRQGDKERAAPQFFKPMLNAASYLDMFSMAADSPERSQLQIFNRYDRCCFNNVRGKLYEAAIQKTITDINGGDFNVMIDETHARHKLSTWGFEKMLKDLHKGEGK